MLLLLCDVSKHVRTCMPIEILCTCIHNLCCIHAYIVFTQGERDYLRKLLSEKDVHVHAEGHREAGQGGSPSVTGIEAQLSEKKCQLLERTKENKELKEKLAQAEAQVH